MVYVLPLLEGLTEGLIYFRRIAAGARLANRSLKAIQIMDGLIPIEGDDTSRTFSEQMYLYMLGVQSLKALQQAQVLPDVVTSREMVKISVEALLQTEQSITSSAPSHIITLFADSLGREVQKLWPQFATKLLDYLEKHGRSYTNQDPVYGFLLNRVPLSDADKTVAQLLEFQEEDWASIQAALSDKKSTIAAWSAAATKKSKGKIYKMQSFFGLVYRGASALQKFEVQPLLITGGPDALSFSMAGLIFDKAKPYSRRRLHAFQGITKADINAMEKRIMASRGMVWDKVTGEYLPYENLDAAQRTTLDNERKGTDKSIEIAAAAALRRGGGAAVRSLAARAQSRAALRNLAKADPDVATD